MRITLSKLLLIFALVIVVSCGILSSLFNNWLHTKVPVSEQDQVILVEKGSSLYLLAQEFRNKDLVAWPSLWIRYAQFKELTSVKAGQYRLPEQVSPKELLVLLNKGKVIQHQVTLVEGHTVKALLEHLHSQTGMNKLLLEQSEAQIIGTLELEVEKLEGWLFPDTYNWVNGDSDIVILRQAHKKMRTVLEQEWQQRAENLPYKNAYQALIMASIVEKETGAAFERDLIAGVFVRRLQKGMRLATDPTVIYGMGEKYQGNITRRDLKTATPYNTYVIKGLPPTPIAAPGREAIHAALHPAKGSALYFVARGDGTHEFSDTLEAHNKAVRKYQLKRRSDYRSSPQK